MGENIRDAIDGMLSSAIENLAANYCPEDLSPADWDLEALNLALHNLIPAQYVEPVLEEELKKEKRQRRPGAALRARRGGL